MNVNGPQAKKDALKAKGPVKQEGALRVRRPARLPSRLKSPEKCSLKVLIPVSLKKSPAYLTVNSANSKLFINR